MSEYAPSAIHRLFEELSRDPAAQDLQLKLGGIVGDRAHVYGYHRARAVLPEDDYSVLLHRDQRGNKWAASALDITPGAAAGGDGVQLLTSRLAGAVQRHDRRLYRVVREVYGSLDGDTVWGWDLRFGHAQESDASHLWHVHLSFYRKFATSWRDLAPLVDVLLGR